MRPCFVIDTNVWVSALASDAPYRIVYEKLVMGKFRMAVSQEILLEYDEIATRKFGVASVYAFRELLTNLPNVELYKTYFQWNFIVADPDDNKFVDLAIAANAQLLVTEDKHFRVLKKVAFPKITLANADEFVRLLATDQFQ